MAKETETEEILDKIEERIKSVTKLARQLTTGNVSHTSGNIICILDAVITIYLPKARKSLENHE